jgi:hypothetical protein
MNNEDIYDGLKTLKGSTKSRSNVEYGQKFLPQAYVEILFVAIFCSTTFSSIAKFKTNLGKTPYEMMNLMLIL